VLEHLDRTGIVVQRVVPTSKSTVQQQATLTRGDQDP
jgi:hypothetical protein